MVQKQRFPLSLLLAHNLVKVQKHPRACRKDTRGSWKSENQCADWRIEAVLGGVLTAQAEDWTLERKRDVKQVSHKGVTGWGQDQVAGGGAGTVNFRPRSTESHQQVPTEGLQAPIAQGTKSGKTSPTLWWQKKRERKSSWKTMFFKKKWGLQMETPKLKKQSLFKTKYFQSKVFKLEDTNIPLTNKLWMYCFCCGGWWGYISCLWAVMGVSQNILETS